MTKIINYYLKPSEGIVKNIIKLNKLFMGFRLETPWFSICGRKPFFFYGLILILSIVFFYLKSWLFFSAFFGLLMTITLLFIYAIKVFGWTETIYLKTTLSKRNRYTHKRKYKNIVVYDVFSPRERRTRFLSSDGILQSAMFLNSPHEPVWDYGNYYLLGELFVNQPKSILCLGGGGYSIPKDMIKRYPKCRVDVVELVPEITWIAERYFYAKHKRIRSFNQDAREFLEKNKNLKYDLIYIDISLGGKFCYSLATREAARALLSHLKKDGVLVSNAGKAIGKNLFKAVKAIYKTYGTVFTQVFAFSSERTERKKGKRRKITLLASKSSRKYLFVDLKKLAGKDKLKSKLINTRVKINTRDIPVLKDGSFPKHDRKLAYRLYPPEIFKKEVNEDSGRGWTL